MDTIHKTRDNSKRRSKEHGRRGRRDGGRSRRVTEAQRRTQRGTAEAVPLICECDTIPFAHFIFQCMALVEAERVSPLAPDLLPACNTGVGHTGVSGPVDDVNSLAAPGAPTE